MDIVDVGVREGTDTGKMTEGKRKRDEWHTREKRKGWANVEQNKKDQGTRKRKANGKGRGKETERELQRKGCEGLGG